MRGLVCIDCLSSFDVVRSGRYLGRRLFARCGCGSRLLPELADLGRFARMTEEEREAAGVAVKEGDG